MYQYKMIQVPPNISVEVKHEKGNEAAAYLEGVVNQYATQGWEFHRVDSIGVELKPGCLAGLGGAKTEASIYYVVTFRKPV